MRSALSNIVFVLGFTLGLVIAGYFLLVGGIADVIESFQNDPAGWLLAIWGVFKAVGFVVAAFVAFFIAAAVGLMIGDGDSTLRRVLVRWQDKADAKWLRKQRAKSSN